MGGIGGEHHAGLHVAAVDAVTHLGFAEQVVEIDGSEPGAADRQHAEFDSDVAADDVDEADLSAVTVEDQQPPRAGPRHAAGDIEPDLPQCLGGNRQRALEGEMLVGLADPLHRQNQHIDAVGEAGDGLREDRLAQRGVDGDGQMRSVLLGRRHGEDHDGVSEITRRKFSGRQVVPAEGFGHAHSAAAWSRKRASKLSSTGRSAER